MSGFRNVTNQNMLRNMPLTLSRWLSLEVLATGTKFWLAWSNSLVLARLFLIFNHHFRPVRNNVRRRECLNCKMYQNMMIYHLYKLRHNESFSLHIFSIKNTFLNNVYASHNAYKDEDQNTINQMTNSITMLAFHNFKQIRRWTFRQFGRGISIEESNTLKLDGF